jgi:hypothetical protein
LQGPQLPDARILRGLLQQSIEAHVFNENAQSEQGNCQ